MEMVIDSKMDPAASEKKKIESDSKCANQFQILN